MPKNYTVDEMLVIGLVFSILLCLSFYLPLNQTGKGATSEINTSIREKMDIDFTAFNLPSSISIIDNANITIEVTNTGSTTYNSTMTIYVYNLSNGTQLNLLSTYVDSTRVLYPGNSRGQMYIFAPASEGSYFVKGSVRYSVRVKEIWGSFQATGFSQLPPPPPPPPSGNQTNQTNQTQPPSSGGGGSTGGGGGAGGGGQAQQGNGTGGGTGTGSGTGTSTGTVPITLPSQPPVSIVPSAAAVSLDFPERIIIYRNISSLLGIKVTNTGGATISGLNMYVSTPTLFNTDINPKGKQFIFKNDSLTFLITLFTSDAPIGEYTLEFKMISGSITKEGAVILDVKEAPSTLKDLIYLRILNYRFLVNDISSQINSLGIKGYDVSVPRRFITAAKDGIDRAQAFYDENENVKAFGELLDVEQNLKDAVFTLGNVAVKLYAVQRADYYLLIFVVPVVLFLIILRRRRKDRRPKLLREAKEE